jgi:hypothetical protein
MLTALHNAHSVCVPMLLVVGWLLLLLRLPLLPTTTTTTTRPTTIAPPHGLSHAGRRMGGLASLEEFWWWEKVIEISCMFDRFQPELTHSADSLPLLQLPDERTESLNWLPRRTVTRV